MKTMLVRVIMSVEDLSNEKFLKKFEDVQSDFFFLIKLDSGTRKSRYKNERIAVKTVVHTMIAESIRFARKPPIRGATAREMQNAPITCEHNAGFR